MERIEANIEGAGAFVRPLAKKVAIGFTAAVLAACLGPGVALAGQLQAGEQADLATQASGKTLYVLSSVTEQRWGSSAPEIRQTLKYDSNGFLKKRVNAFNGLKSSNTWSYDKNGNLSSAKWTQGGMAEKYTFKTNGSGLITKEIVGSEAYTYNVSSGQVKSCTVKRGDLASRVTYSHKGGRVSAEKSSEGWKRSFSYDAKGNLKKVKGTRKIDGNSVAYNQSFSNRYDSKGRLTKSVVTNDGGSTITKTYSYEAIKVSAASAAKVKAQQWALKNTCWDGFIHACEVNPSFDFGSSLRWNVIMASG